MSKNFYILAILMLLKDVKAKNECSGSENSSKILQIKLIKMFRFFYFTSACHLPLKSHPANKFRNRSLKG